MARTYRLLSTTVTLVLPLFCRPSNALLATGFNITKPSWFFNGILTPEIAVQLPESCVAAYTEPINCNVTILMSPNLTSKNETLEESCNPECAAALLSFQRDVREACKDIDLEALDLDMSWLEAVIDGEAGVLLYWKQCLRDLGTNKLCEVSERDYRIAWDAVTADSTNNQAIQRFCADNCLTQSVVLNAPTESNLADLRTLCSSIDIEEYPFIDAMVFANLVKDDNDTVVAPETTANMTLGSGETSESCRQLRIGLVMVSGIFLMYIFVLF